MALFTLGGGASGMYLMSFLTGILERGLTDLQQPAVFKLIPPVMVCLGFLLISIEAGRPLRGLYIFRQLRFSWMSREIIAGMVFVVAALLDWKAPHIALQLLASVGAFSLMISQAGILYDARAIRTWNSNLIRWLSLTANISLGTGLILLITGLEKLSFDKALILIGACCIAFNLLLWLLYIGDQKILNTEAMKSMRSLKSLFVTVVIGHVIPVMMLLLIFWRRGYMPGSGLNDASFVIVGLAVLAGAIWQRKSIILEAGYLRAIVLAPHKSI